jgi:signal peptidase II
MVLGGALGNFVDRVRYGFVVDFIDVWVKVEEGSFLSKFMDLGESHWPTFNIADVSICIGVGLMAVDMFVGQGSQGEADEKPDKESESDAAENDSPRASELTETEVDTESPSSALIASEAGAASDAAPVVVDPSDASEAPAEGA